MTKAALKYFLSLGILLLSVYGNLYAHGNKVCNCHSFKSTLVSAEQSRFSAGQNTQFQSIKATLSVTESENCKIIAAEIEEEKHEWISFKKYLAQSNYFTTLFYVLAFGYFSLFIKKCLDSFKHALYFSTIKWFLLFRVIRI
ncbi:hypothetical protein [Adhaeribacter rhizoryzae]|uniref:Uncharacterized protein n=1 Tax=Adhaeribacter rhizoryzae TaxID=2607907 RepID=A0A5M6DKG0_9BACT|nr:hypothetical protein [Adhaeribacter rhizoryzae]KAA5546772.1 hypothetical protein F0145_10580 [Adhaeribacter rhizoryzae]